MTCNAASGADRRSDEVASKHRRCYASMVRLDIDSGTLALGEPPSP